MKKQGKFWLCKCGHDEPIEAGSFTMSLHNFDKSRSKDAVQEDKKGKE